MFLHDIAYQAHMRAIDLEILTNNNNASVRNFAEEAGIEEIKSYLRRRFDVALIFIDVTNWSTTPTYNEGDHVVKNGAMYYAIAASTNEDPETPSSTFWTLGDLRDKYLVMRAVDCVTYHLYAKIPKRSTPEDVGLRYDETIKWLNGVSTGNLIPNYPLLSDDEANNQNEFKFGSQEKKNHRW